jgi:hypothetical protein
MKIEVGKTYVTRDGKHNVTITVKVSHSRYRGKSETLPLAYKSNKYPETSRFTWRVGGLHREYDNECNIDLIAEVNKIKIEVGKTYLTRDGYKIRVEEDPYTASGEGHADSSLSWLNIVAEVTP